MAQKKDKRIDKLEAKLEALLKHLKLEILAEEDSQDKGFYFTKVFKRKKSKWEL